MLSVAAVLIIFAAVLGTGTMVAFFAWLLNRLRQIEDGGDSRALVEQVHAIREQLLDVQDQLTALEERTDFTERLLTGGEGEDDDA